MSDDGVDDRSREVLSVSEHYEDDFYGDVEPRLRSNGLNWMFLFAVLLMAVTHFGLEIPSLPASLIAPFGGLSLPPLFFILYWGGLNLIKIRQSTCLRITVTLAIVVGLCSLGAYLDGWNYSSPYVSADRVLSWKLGNGICMLVIGWVTIKTCKAPSYYGLMILNFLIFAWVLSYAFPWSGVF